ncbi:Gfo/Idh/MocA family protein [Undibacterium flavidum]|uniref:Gfo/Idh/MocA family oxidoreductase n=1 Tax=Undibacterium flavidum TaxID=2762297 RepID=A0ABR6YH24_9BURK|nr:Gfo/Idh/MocA family oxidoreductase [Undibacterium flavidum]MBC3875866.1 Gfo/Idh/MocA family oxidoreductase [Undibacterium flavidum]
MTSSTTASRRGFLQSVSSLTAGLASLTGLSSISNTAQAQSDASTSGANTGTTKRAAKSKYMGDFRASPLAQVKVAIIGVGARGSGHAAQLAGIEGVQFVGIADVVEARAKKSEAAVSKFGHTPKVYSGDENGWRKMLAETKPDAVFINTPWSLHAPMAIAAMQAGAHAFVEVPIATTLKDMWDIVDTSEATGRHCMMMENVNYGREELLYLNMVRQGVLGDLLHGEASYIHALRFQMENGDSTGSWRTFEYAKRNGNLYPTHGLGPVAQYMNLARGEDTFGRISSFSSPAKGRAAYAKKSTKLTSPAFKELDFKGGDLNTSIIKTGLGRTIMVQWDETTPRPYSRHNMIMGVNGVLAGFPNRISVEGITSNYHKWAEGKEWEDIAAKYEHPLYVRLGELSKKMGGHGGMDFLMLYRIIECLRKGDALDQNVYEGCFWSAVGPLSEKSVAEDGNSQVFPDFTRGDWKSTNPLKIIA